MLPSQAVHSDRRQKKKKKKGDRDQRISHHQLLGNQQSAEDGERAV